MSFIANTTSTLNILKIDENILGVFLKQKKSPSSTCGSKPRSVIGCA